MQESNNSFKIIEDLNRPLSSEDIKERAKYKVSRIQALFSTPEGKEVLKFLNDEFNGTELFVMGDPHATSYRLGQRDVYVYLEQAVKSKILVSEEI